METTFPVFGPNLRRKMSNLADFTGAVTVLVVQVIQWTSIAMEDCIKHFRNAYEILILNND